MTIFLQGLAIPLNKINVNGWGIPSTESANVISSLKASQLRVCPGESHACDLTMDPYGRIGHIIDAWEEEDGIHAKAEVTDSKAASKLTEGTWSDFKWSMYGDSKTNPVNNDGWAGGVTIKSMTLVKNPAFSDARFQIAASLDGLVTELRTFSDFKLISESFENNIEGDKIPDDFEKTITELTASKAELEKKVTELTASVADKDKSLNLAVNDITDTKTALDEANKSIETLEASVKDLETKLGEKTTLIASLEKEREGKVPMDKVETLIAAAIEKHDAEKVAEAERLEAFKLFASTLDPDAKIEDYPNLSAADFKRLTETVGTKLAASKDIKYPANPSNSFGWTVGRPTADGKWEA